MIYFFHHYELPAILQQARIQQILVQSHQQQQQQQPNGEQQPTGDAAENTTAGQDVVNNIGDNNGDATPATHDAGDIPTQSPQQVLANGDLPRNGENTVTESQNGTNGVGVEQEDSMQEHTGQDVQSVDLNTNTQLTSEPKTLHGPPNASEPNTNLSDLPSTGAWNSMPPEEHLQGGPDFSPNQPNEGGALPADTALRYRNMSRGNAATDHNSTIDTDAGEKGESTSGTASTLSDHQSSTSIGAKDNMKDCDQPQGVSS